MVLVVHGVGLHHGVRLLALLLFGFAHAAFHLLEAAMELLVLDEVLDFSLGAPMELLLQVLDLVLGVAQSLDCWCLIMLR